VTVVEVLPLIAALTLPSTEGGVTILNFTDALPAGTELIADERLFEGFLSDIPHPINAKIRKDKKDTSKKLFFIKELLISN
jgi:hypothetical protein